MPEGFAKDKGFRHADHIERGLHAGGNALLFDRVLQGERVDDGSEHSHVIRGGAVHAGALTAAPEIAAADDDADLHAHIVYADELIDDAGDDLFVQPEALISRERLARKF